MTGTIEMFSKEEMVHFGLAFFGFLTLLIAWGLIAAVAPIITDFLREKFCDDKDQELADKLDELTACVSDAEYYELAQKALDEQKMIEFKCIMNGFEKAIKVLKSDE